MKTTITFILLLILASGCANRNILSQQSVTTQYLQGTDSMTWQGKQAKKQLPLDKLRVLVVDQTSIHEKEPFVMPPYANIYEYPKPIDTIVASRYYNYHLLNAIRIKYARIPQVQVIPRPMSQDAMDELVASRQYDVVIAARDIRFAFYTQSKDMGNAKSTHPQAIIPTSISPFHNMPPVYYIERYTSMNDIGYKYQESPFTFKVLAFLTQWEINWIGDTAKPNHLPDSFVYQQGAVRNEGTDYATALVNLAQEAGKCMMQLFQF